MGSVVAKPQADKPLRSSEGLTESINSGAFNQKAFYKTASFIFVFLLTAVCWSKRGGRERERER